MATRFLTKSRFKLALSCPTKLFYTGKKEYANTNDSDEFLAMLADGGFQVGELAKLMYPGGIEIKTKDSTQALAETSQYLTQQNIVLFEPAIAFEGYLIRVDVLVKRGHVIEVIEVKAKSYSGDPASLSGTRSPIKSDILPYIQDVAFQKYVVQHAFPSARVSAYLLMPDKSKHAATNGMNQWFKVRREGRSTEVIVDPRALQPNLAESVLTCVGVDHLVNEVLNNDLEIPGGHGSMTQLTKLWVEAYQADQRIPPVIGSQCAHCEFRTELGGNLRSGFHECWKSANNWTDTDFADGTVLDLWNFKGKDKLIQAGKRKLKQVTEEDLKLKDHDLGTLTNDKRQWLQVNGLPEDAVKDGFYLDRDGLAHEMRSWTFPLHMIDFETASVALPFHAGRRPYEQVAFQFSHHVVEANGDVRHADECLLAEPGYFPNYEFVRALRIALSNDHGTIMRWSHHENSILNAIKVQLEQDEDRPPDASDLIGFIDSITKGGSRAMVDLAEVAKKHYFHPSTKGSNSIKKVLPAVMRSSEFLKNTFGQPIYGGQGRVPSRNFQNMVWWQVDSSGDIFDPYKLLVASLDGSDEYDTNGEGINQGGAASYAYLRLQFEDMQATERASFQKALLKYCELDTMAMVMILQAWAIAV